MAFFSSFDNDFSSVAICIASSAEDVLAAGMLVVDVLVLADDCTPYKCCIICSLTFYEKIKKIAHTEAKNTDKLCTRRASIQITHPFTEAENKTLLLFVNVN
jgi:hypothetical protein